MTSISRRDMIMSSAAAASLATMNRWGGILPGVQPGEEVIPWTDVPANFAPRGQLDSRSLDRSQFYTPNDSFYLVQHYGIQEVDAASWRLKVSGLVKKPIELTLDEIKKRPRFEQVVGWECGGSNPARLNVLTGNAKWVGTRLRDLLNDAGLESHAKEVVFFGVDKGKEKVTHGRSGELEVEQHFGRSLYPEDALRPEVMLAWEMNGAPLSASHGAPLRLVVPGMYGVANVKWINRIHAQDTRFIGRFMSRDYVTFVQRQVGDETIWDESLVARMRVKSMVARLTRSGGKYSAFGFALAGALPLKSLEVRVDDGPWQRATMDPQNTERSWQLFSYSWTGLTPGEHTIVSRAVDANGVMQPEAAVVDQKKTQWENNGLFVRKFTI